MILPKIAAAIETFRPRAEWRIVVAGSGPLKDKLEAAVERYDMGHRFAMLGWQRDTPAMFHASDIALLPSLWEGLPRVLIEAQAAGLPVVASDIKGNREVVNEATGILCEPLDADAYAAPLVGLIDNRLMRQGLGTAARRRAEDMFDVDANVGRIIQLYEELLTTGAEVRRAA